MRARFNIRQTKALIWVGCVALFALDGWTFFDIYQKKQQGDYTANTQDYYTQILRDGAAEVPAVKRGPSLPERSQYETLWTALIAWEDPDPEEVKQTDVNHQPVAETLKAIEDVLEVSLVFYSSEPAMRFVAVQYKDALGSGSALGKQRRLHISEGETLKPPYDAEPYNARVIEIRPQQVVFQWGEDQQTVNPGLGRDGKGVAIKDFEVPVRGESFADYETAPAESVFSAEGEWLLGTNDLAAVSSDPHKFLQDQLSVRTLLPKSGERSMLELTHVEEGSLAHRLGARTSDRIISVNGIPMTSVSAALNWFKAHPDEGRYVVKLERAGATKTMVFNTK